MISSTSPIFTFFQAPDFEMPPRPPSKGACHSITSPRNKRQQREVDVVLPLWLYQGIKRIAPIIKYPEVLTSILTGAVIVGIQTNGKSVEKAQVEYANTTLGSPKSLGHNRFNKGIQVHHLYLTEFELNQLEDYRNEISVTQQQAAIRTAMFVGLRIPGARAGIINEPISWLFDLEYYTDLCIGTGTLTKQMAQDGGYYFYHDLLNSLRLLGVSAMINLARNRKPFYHQETSLEHSPRFIQGLLHTLRRYYIEYWRAFEKRRKWKKKPTAYPVNYERLAKMEELAKQP